MVVNIFVMRESFEALYFMSIKLSLLTDPLWKFTCSFLSSCLAFYDLYCGPSMTSFVLTFGPIISRPGLVTLGKFGPLALSVSWKRFSPSLLKLD